MMNFALTGVAGYVARRHLEAIRDTGNRLVAAVDPHDSVGILDQYFPEAGFFTEFERFDRHLEKLRRGPSAQRVHYLSVCSPNYLHDAHIRLALRIGANAICEKPLVINPWNLDALQELESESEGEVCSVLQLRHLPSVMELKRRIDAEPSSATHDVTLTCIAGRGVWYRYSWKGSEERSGGLVSNIGIHFFDLLLWLFGAVRTSEVQLSETTRAAGIVELDRARVRWFLSIDPKDGPVEASPGGMMYKSIVVDDNEVELSGGVDSLHTRVYEEIIAGRGLGIDAVRPAIELVHSIRSAVPSSNPDDAHPLARAALQRGTTR